MASEAFSAKQFFVISKIFGADKDTKEKRMIIVALKASQLEHVKLSRASILQQFVFNA